MSQNNGFFYKLGVLTDKNSFEQAYKSFDEMNNKVNRLIGTMRNAAIVGATLKIADMSNQENKLSAAIGVSTDALDAWKAAASIAGVNANGLISSLSKLSSVMKLSGITKNSGLKEYQEQLAMLKLGMNELMDLSADAAFQKIFEAAENAVAGGTDKAAVAQALNRILGTDGMNLFLELQSRGKTIGDFLAGAANVVYMDESSHKKADDLADATNLLKTQLAEIGKFFGAEIGGEFTPLLTSISDWITENKDTIKTGIKKISEATETIVTKVSALGSWLFQDKDADHKALVEGITGAAGSTINAGFGYNGISNELLYSMLAEGATPAEQLKYQEEYNLVQRIKKAGGFNKTISAKEVTDALVNDIIKYQEYGGNFDLLPLEADARKLITGKYGVVPQRNQLQDGIIRPDGTVTQVAPDDWVFAARNLGDLAQAFIPQGMAAGAENNTFTIVQNFTMANNSDMGQTIRQHAYNGVRDGLQASLQRSSLTLQQMSGTR